MNTDAQLVHVAATLHLAEDKLAGFEWLVNNMTHDYQLTQCGKELARGHEWRFVGDDYRRAWGYLFQRARQLGLTYCKHFKRFYKPLPPKPVIGDRVRLASTGATGTVIGYHRFDVVVSIDNELRDAIVGVEFLEKMQTSVPLD